LSDLLIFSDYRRTGPHRSTDNGEAIRAGTLIQTVSQHR